jgi:leucyl-tRNA synthetase
VLANEQVVDGACERCDTLVEAKKLSQWFFRITDYAERLLQDFDKLESWPERVVTMQRNWIGKSTGADVIFTIAPAEDAVAGEDATKVTVFTTRPDTLFGATFFIVAPEHPLVEELVAGTPEEAEVKRYVAKAMATSHIERSSIEKEKTGVFTGRYSVNPVTGGKIPIYVADYVLMDYGTGAIMAVPAHDERDFAFAKKYGLEVIEVIQSPDDYKDSDGDLVQAYTGDGLLVNSGEFSGLPKAQGIVKVTEWLKGQGKADFAVNYKLRDWLLSRQRYWGAPIPIIYCDKSRCRTIDFRCCCPISPTTRPRADRRSRPPSNGSAPPARCAVVPPGGRPTPWTRSSTRPGTTCGTPRRGGATWPSTAPLWITGCRWTSTSAGWSTPSCI